MSRPTLILAAAAAAVAIGVLTGCSPQAPAAPTTPAVESLAPGVEATPTAAPTLHPDGSAEQNRLYYKQVLDHYAITHGMGTSAALLESLVEAGYDPALVELTSDTTAIGLTADSIEVSVRFGEECLLADVRTESVIVHVAEVLGTGKCLIGETWQGESG